MFFSIFLQNIERVFTLMYVIEGWHVIRLIKNHFTIAIYTWRSCKEYNPIGGSFVLFYIFGTLDFDIGLDLVQSEYSHKHKVKLAHNIGP